MNCGRMLRLGLVGLGLLSALPAWSEDKIQIAVAANFLSTAEALAKAYRAESTTQLLFSAASTGKLYAQIRNGLPVDLFLSADSARPQLLIDEGLADGAGRWTYAIGELSFWAPQVAGDSAACERWLRAGDYQKLALANPRTAPYGAAAEAVLERMGLSSAAAGHLVQGENIAQAFVFIDSGAAQAGFVAHSQIITRRAQPEGLQGCSWEPDAAIYPELRQDAVILSTATERTEVWQLTEWLQGAAAREIIRAAGYRLP